MSIEDEKLIVYFSLFVSMILCTYITFQKSCFLFVVRLYYLLSIDYGVGVHNGQCRRQITYLGCVLHNKILGK